MGSKPQKETTVQENRVPDYLQQQNKELLNQIFQNSNAWYNPAKGSLQEQIRDMAMGAHLGDVNEREQAAFDQQLAQQKNNLERQYAAAGRMGSYSNLEASNGLTSSMTNQFLSDNFNRNRQDMLNARQQYLAGLMGAQNDALNAINSNRQNTTVVNKPGRTWFENLLSLGGLLTSNFGNDKKGAPNAQLGAPQSMSLLPPPVSTPLSPFPYYNSPYRR